MISRNKTYQNPNETPKSVISSNLSFFKEGKFEDLKQFYQKKDRVLSYHGAGGGIGSRKRVRSTDERDTKYLNPADMNDSCQNQIKVSKVTSSNNAELQHLTFKSIDEALCSLKGDVWIAEFLLVINPGKPDSNGCDQFEIHGVDKIYRQYLGTIFLTRDELSQFEKDNKFENYSMIVSNTPLDLKTSLESVLGPFDCFNENACSSGLSSPSVRVKSVSPFKIERKKSEPTLQDLLTRLDQSSKVSADLTNFFDFAEKYEFSTIIRPDFVNFSNQLILDFFTPHENYVGTLTLTNQEIENQLGKHQKLLAKLRIIEDTNEIVASKGVARFLRKCANLLNLLYIYDYMSELVYKIYENI